MTLRVGLAGFDRPRRRLADAIARQPDMRLTAIHTSEPMERQLAVALGMPLVAAEQLAGCCDVVAERLPDPDAVALVRLLDAVADLLRPRRVFATIVMRSADCVDALAPEFTLQPQRLAALTFRGVSWHVRRVGAPYTHSHLYMVQVEGSASCARSAILQALRQHPRIHVLAGRDGFPDTASVQEYFRDLGPSRADRLGLLIWEESVHVEADRLYLLMDFCPDAGPIPEAIDTLRLGARSEFSIAAAQQQTNLALASLLSWPGREVAT